MSRDMSVEEARRMIVQAMARLTYRCVEEPTLEARNLQFAAEEFLNALDAYYSQPATDEA